MILRDYQSDAVNALFEYFNSGNPGNPLIVMPTGTGKSVVIAALIQKILTDYPTTRVLMATHVKELIQQNLDKLLRVWPMAPVGVYSAGLKQNNTDAPILFCGIQSVWNKAKALSSEARPIELVFIDECHRVPLQVGGTYRRFIAALTRLNPHLRLIGLTATPYRHIPGTKTMTGGYQSLTVGDDRLFTDIAYDLTASLVPLIRQDYLAALWPQPTDYRVCLKDIRIENGDYKADQLNALMEQDAVIDAILAEAIPLAQADDRKHWLVFCAGAAAAHKTAANLQARGISAAVVEGNTPAKDRAQFIADFKVGRLTALVSVGVLTTGFDAPVTDCLIIARPTISPVLHVQIMGRGMRPTDAKCAMEGERRRGCLVLDFCGNVDRHGPIDHLQLKGPSPKKREPTKTCPECQAEISQFANPCPQCCHEFDVAEKPPVEAPQAGKSAIIAGISPIVPPVRYSVSRVAYSRHVGKSGIPTLRVDYFSGFLRVASEWVCLEHSGWARQKAEKWWAERDGTLMTPTIITQNVVDNADEDLKRPTAILVRTLPGKDAFPEIVKYEWDPVSQPVSQSLPQPALLEAA
jgi:DNA repair protein RadD